MMNSFSNIIQTTVGTTPTLILPKNYKKSILTIWYNKLTGALGSLAYNSKFASANPYGVAVDDTRIYVTDYNNHLIRIYDRFTYAAITTFGGGPGAGDGQFNFPADVDTDDLFIYVADQSNLRVQIFDKITFAFVAKITTIDACYGVAVDQGEIIRNEFNGTPAIRVYDKYSLVQNASFGAAATFRPLHVDYDDTYIYGADFFNNNVQRWTRALPNTLANTYATGLPNFGITVYDTGFFVSHHLNHRVRVYDFNGVLLGNIGNGVAGAADGQFNQPRGLYLKEDLLFVADTVNNRVQIFNALLIPNVFVGRSDVRTSFGFAIPRLPYSFEVGKDVEVYGIANTPTPVYIIQNFEED